MATDKTISTELSLCFGVLNLPLNRSIYINDMLSVQNVTEEAINRLFLYYNSNSGLLDKMWEVGNRLRPYINNRIRISPSTAVWEGGQRQSSSVRVSKDLSFASILYLSVKADSDVVFNKSPRGLLVDLPSGNIPRARSENWFVKEARDELQGLYEWFNPGSMDLPKNVEDFFREVKGSDRNSFKRYITPFFRNNDDVKNLYQQLCQAVSCRSASIFNSNIGQLFSPKVDRNSISNFCEHCFRLNSIPYILAGIDKGKQFAVDIPNSTTWNSKYRVDSIQAFPRPNRHQPEIGFAITLTDSNNKTLKFNFRIEIRWSHGKFCGNPEGKLYKEFSYSDLPWVSQII